MLKPEQVPEGVWRAAMSTYHKTLRKNPGMAWQEAITAAINAWPGMFHHPARPDEEECIFLPVDQDSTRTAS